MGRGLIKAEALEEALAEQARQEVPGRTLGVLLVSRGLLRPEDLVSLLEEQDRLSRALAEYAGRQGLLFGQLLVKNNQSTQNQVNKCLEIQRELARQGRNPVPRLGEILIEHGYVDRAAVASTLRLQDKDLLLCPSCGRQFNVVGAESREAYRCGSCGGMLARPAIGELRAEETRFGFELRVWNK